MRWKKGGATVATLFLLVFLWLSTVVLRADDGIIWRVPGSAVFYAHGDLRTASWAALPDLDPLHPHEFGVVTVRGTEGLSTAVIVRWLPFTGPDAQELRELGRSEAAYLGNGTYAMGSGDAVRALRDASPPSLTDLTEVADALRTLRSAFGLQVYADGTTFHEALRTAVEQEPLVGGISADGMRMTGVAAPVSRLATGFPLGFAMPKPSRTLPALPRTIAAPQEAFSVIVGDPSPSFDLFGTVFHGIEDARHEVGTPDSDVLADAKAALGSALEPSVVTLMGTDEGMKTVLTLPPQDGAAFIDALSAYLRASFPHGQRLSLPDGDSATEFIYRETDPVFEGDGAVQRLSEPLRSRLGIDLFLRASAYGMNLYPDARTAALLGEAEHRPLRTGCPGSSGDVPAVVYLQENAYGAAPTAVAAVLERSDVDEVRVRQVEDKFISFCGYSHPHVDK